MRNVSMARVSWFLAVVVAVCAIPVPAFSKDQQEAPRQTIPAEEFTASPFADYFKADDYERALEALEPLLKQYPDDPLVLRYKAMTLDRLGRSEEAIAIYQQLLKQVPEHAPTRFFLGEAYERLGKHDEAVREWRWVAQRSQAKEYAQWAKDAIARVGAAEMLPRRKRWLVLANVGWDWDNNVILKPNDKALANVGDQNAGRFTIDVGLRYRALSAPDAYVDLMYTSRQSLHDDSLDDFNFTSEEVGIDARKRVDVGGREVTLGGRYELLSGFLEGDLFALSNRFLLSADTRFTPHTRTALSNRFTVSNFGPDGSNPPQTSRDGIYNDLALTQYLYSADFTRYLFVRQEYNAAGTRGGNFDRRGLTTRVGAHSPLLWRTDADVSSGFLYNAYPQFTSLSALDAARRRDTTWDVALAVTHHLSEALDVRVQYQWVNALNRNDLFQYDRHIAGVHLLLSQAF